MIQAGILGVTGYAMSSSVRLPRPSRDPEVPAGVGFFLKETPPRPYPTLRSLRPPLRSGKDRAGPERSGLRRPAPRAVPGNRRLVTRRARRYRSGADFRLDDPETYKTWYGCDALSSRAASKAVYGLPELFPR